MPEFLQAELLKDVKKQKGFDVSYTWKDFLNEIVLTRDDYDSQHLVGHAVPVTAFASDEITKFVDNFTRCRFFWVFAPVHEFKEVLGADRRVFWIASLVKIVGCRALFNWLGSSADDFQNDFFWANLFSKDIREPDMFAGRIMQRWIDAPNEERSYDFSKIYSMHSDSNRKEEQIHPPPYLYSQLKGKVKFALPEPDPQIIRAIDDDFKLLREQIIIKSKYTIGQRVELLDNLNCTRMRPARIVNICGRRVCVQVKPDECSIKDDEDRQYGEDTDFWVDEDSLLIFPVGWAASNNYKIEASTAYKNHTERIAEAIFESRDPEYDVVDVRPEQMSHYGKGSTAEWKQGMKLELLDPLGASMNDLQVATVLGIKREGYLIIGLDGPDIEDESFPIHCTSPLIFPVGYAEKHGIPLRTPDGVKKFKWDHYLLKTKSVAAPNHLFKEDPCPKRVALFKPKAKLEACDLCDNHMICPASVVGVKGRLVHIQFDGWGSKYDQMFDIDSKDLFPLGWCEIQGYKLQFPKGG